jgi:WD40 repeat protein
MLAAGGGRMQPSVLIWGYDGGLKKELTIDTDMILSIAWSPDSSLLAVGLGDREKMRVTS